MIKIDRFSFNVRSSGRLEKILIHISKPLSLPPKRKAQLKLPGLAGEYPLLLIRDDGSSVLRAVMGVNEDKSIVYAGTVPEGSKVRFSMPPGFEIIEHAIEQMSEFNQQIPKSDAIVLFSCKARHVALGQRSRNASKDL